MGAEQLTEKDRAFIRRALLIAVDMSEKSGVLTDIYHSFVSASVRQSVQSLVISLAK